MRIDFQPVSPPHVCDLPDPTPYPPHAVIVCEGTTAFRFNGRDGLTEVRCNQRWTRLETWWKRTPKWYRVDTGW